MSDTVVTHLLRSGLRAHDPFGGLVSLQSHVGLKAANFILVEVGSVVMPFLATFLAERDWRENAIGTTIALAGLGVCLMQTRAGFIVDWVRQRSAPLAGASLVVSAGARVKGDPR